MTEISSPLCYFLTFEEGRIYVQDNDLKPLDSHSLHGLYSFIHYSQPRLMVIGALHEHGSQHSGLASIVEALKRQWQSLRNHLFFNKSVDLLLPTQKPIAGGGLFILNGVVVLWHLKSGSYSLPNDMCHDNSPSLDDLIKQIGLPSDRFVSVEQAEKFEREYLLGHFHPNGKLINESSSHVLIDHVREVLKLKEQALEQNKKHHMDQKTT